MPLYDYQCRDCGQKFEMLRRIQDADRNLHCPACRSDQVQRLLSTFSSGGCSSSASGFR